MEQNEFLHRLRVTHIHSEFPGVVYPQKIKLIGAIITTCRLTWV